MVDTINLRSIGFVRYASMPTSRHLASSDDIAWAVSATIGMCKVVPISELLIAFVASYPSIFGIWFIMEVAYIELIQCKCYQDNRIYAQIFELTRCS